MMNINNLKIYDILDVRDPGWSFNLLFRKVSGSWGGHVAPVIQKGGMIGMGNSHASGSEWQPLDRLEERLDNGEIDVRVYRPRYYTIGQLIRASNWWLQHVDGTGYDWWAYIGLAIKVLFWDSWQIDTGKESNWYCVEGAMDGLRFGAGIPLMDGEIYTVRALELFAERNKRLEFMGYI